MSKKHKYELVDFLLDIYTIDELKEKGLAEVVAAGAVRLTQKGIELALEYKKEAEKPSFWNRIFRFFLPKDWRGEFKRGVEMGKGSTIAKKIGGALYDGGKGARRIVDPEHKMKIGEQRKKK